MGIKVVDIHDNEYEFEGPDMRLSVEGVTTLVLKPNTKTGPNETEFTIIGSFINVAAAILEDGE